MQRRHELNERDNTRLPVITFLAVVAFAVAGCGAESTAADAAAGTSTGQAPAAQAQIETGRVAATSATAASLPIEQGIYGSVEDGGCARASLVFFYDGATYGRASDETPASVNAYRIERVGSFTPADVPPSENKRTFDGFTKVWSTELGKPDIYNDIEIQFVGIKALGAGRFIERTGGAAIGNGRYLSSDETYQKCAFSELSPQMQATIRAKRPQLVGGTTPERLSAAAPVKFPPIPQGIYAVSGPEGSPRTTCAAAVGTGSRNSPSDQMASFSPTAWGRSWDGMGDGDWISSGRVERVDALANNQFRILTSESQTITIAVTGQGSFTELAIDGERSGNRYTHCPESSIPDWMRKQFER